MNPILGETYEMLYEDGSHVYNFFLKFLDFYGTNCPSPSHKSLYTLWS